MSAESCQVQAEDNDPPHKGKVKEYQVQINTQPPGYGSFTIPTTVRICDGHVHWFEDFELSAWMGET